MTSDEHRDEPFPNADQLREDPESVKLSTAPFDPRFPFTNQTKNCWQNYVNYHRCVAANDGDASPCSVYKRNYRIICPGFWVERWDEALAEHRYPSDISARYFSEFPPPNSGH